jgi:hypothetical protein
LEVGDSILMVCFLLAAFHLYNNCICTFHPNVAWVRLMVASSPRQLTPQLHRQAFHS